MLSKGFKVLTQKLLTPSLSLDEVYKYVQTQLPLLPSRLFPNQPIESYQLEIDRVLSLLISQN